jgi:hypothetical protein
VASKKMARLRVSSADIVRMKVAALEIEDIRGAMAERASGILAAVAPAAEAVVTWHHYPQGDVYDPGTTPGFSTTLMRQHSVRMANTGISSSTLLIERIAGQPEYLALDTLDAVAADG